ncbi:MAG TPA: DUF4424 domain-containing protein [Caulobacteraceae bacterium]|nr:DUF4424 domain-containing protein [Caulobacteraceae bacterium]
MRTSLKATGGAICGAALLWSAGAAANDSTAELAAGGLVLTKSAAIEMRAEDLFISAKQVRVRYRFANASPHDVTVTVAFPMPDITTEGYDDMLSIPTQDPVNILGFSTLVDSKPVAAQVEQRAIKHGVDQTAYLKSLGVPLAPHLASTNEALDRLPQPVKDALVAKGLAVIDEYGDSATTIKKHWEATWTLKTTYFWRQTFPAGREIVVEHRYSPSVGESAGTEWGSAYFAKQPEYAARRAHYCVDDAFLASVRKTMKAGDVEAPFTEQRIEYILISGANWRAPIGDFRMVVDKGAPANLVSFCADGVKKISPTQFEVRHTNFTPTRNVSIVILQPRPPE